MANKKGIDVTVCDICGSSALKTIKNHPYKVEKAIYRGEEIDCHLPCLKDRERKDALRESYAAIMGTERGKCAVCGKVILHGDKCVDHNEKNADGSRRIYCDGYCEGDWKYLRAYPQTKPDDLPSHRLRLAIETRLKKEQFERAKKAAIEKMAKQMIESGEVK